MNVIVKSANPVDLAFPVEFAKAVAATIKVTAIGPPIPPGVSYRPDVDNFYLDDTRVGMGVEFYRKWHDRRREFPQLAASW